MTKFKVGDRVKRIKNYHMGMNVGDTAKITRIVGENRIYLDKYEGGHDRKNLEIAEIDWQEELK